MLGLRLSIRKYDRANLSIAEKGCEQIELLLTQTHPATLDYVQDWLRSEMLAVEQAMQRWNARDKKRKGRWNRFPKPTREEATRREEHRHHVERRKWVMEARRHILRQIGDACAWVILRRNSRLIQPLYAKRRNHYLSQNQGAFGPHSIIKQAHASGRFYVLDTDLTRCLGRGDLVAVPAHPLWGRPLVYEVKTKSADAGHAAIWLMGAKPTTIVDALAQREFCEVLGLNSEPEQPLREREQRQLEEVKSGTYRINELWKRIAHVLREVNENHWSLIEKVLNRTQHQRIAFEEAEPGVVYAGLRNGPGDDLQQHTRDLLQRVKQHGFGADAGYSVLFSMELQDPDREMLASMALPIALWDVNRHQRTMLLNEVLYLCCLFDALVWEKAITQEQVKFEEEHGFWRLSRGDSSMVFDQHEVVKLKLSIAFGAMSPRAFARVARESLDADDAVDTQS
jgi:hypothetical protein